jgi:hypothetical protein
VGEEPDGGPLAGAGDDGERVPDLVVAEDGGLGVRPAANEHDGAAGVDEAAGQQQGGAEEMDPREGNGRTTTEGQPSSR